MLQQRRGQLLSSLPIPSANLVAWWDASQDVYNDAGSTLASDGNSVQEWHDQIAGYVLGQTTASYKPTYVASGVNGYPSISFDGSSDWLQNQDAAVLAPFQGAGLWTVYGLTVQDFYGGYKPVVFIGDFSDSSEYQNMTPYPAGGLPAGSRRRDSDNSAVDASSGTSYSPGNWMAFCWMWDGTNVNIQWNAAAIASAAQTGDSPSDYDNFVVGAVVRSITSGGGWQYPGDVTDIIVYDTSHDASTRSTVLSYLMTKGGL